MIRYGTVDIDEIEKIRRKYFKENIEINRRKVKCCICGTGQTYIRPDGLINATKIFVPGMSATTVLICTTIIIAPT